MKNEHISDELLIQAEEMKTGEEISSEKEVVTFDTAAKNELNFAAIYDDVTSDLYTEDYGLGDFLSRPTKIAHYTVTPGAPFAGSTLQPWDLFLNNARILKKIDNYSYIQAKMHIKIIVNSTPFIYGLIGAYYTPTPAYIDIPAQNILQKSQAANIWLDLSSSTGGEMTLPFLYHKNWLPLGVRTDVQNFGYLNLYQVVQAAIATAGVTSTPSFTVYAWLEDVRLYGNTIALALQAEETTGGPVSRVASTIASASSYFTEIPVIGRFAKAINIGSSAIGAVASMFGFTNHPVIDNVSPYKNLPFHAFSSAHISNVVDKLTLDPKNELAIAPSTVGLPNEDELAITNLVAKPALLAQPVWQTTDASLTLLFAANVTPTVCQVDTATPNETKLYDTPMGMTSRMFSNWRGDLYYHFKIVKTPYHRGRLVVNYDPTGDIVTTSDNNNVVQTLIVDISEVDEFKIRVPYMAPQNFLIVRDTAVTDYAINGGVITGYNNDFCNGRLTVRVLNNLTAPLDTASVTLNCFVYAAENFELSNPTPLSFGSNLYAHHFDIQAGEVDPLKERMGHRNLGEMRIIEHTMGKSTPTPEHIYDVSMGERIASIREILRRTEYVGTERAFDATAGTSTNLYAFMHTKWPPAAGFDPNGIHGAQQINGASTDVNYNFTNFTNFNWISSCFIGMRGSTIWHYNLHNVDPASTMQVRRQYNSILGVTTVNTRANLRAINTNVLATSYSNTARANISRRASTSGGSSLINQRTQTGLSVLYPHYNKFRLVYTKPNIFTYGTSTDDTINEKFVLEILAPNKNGTFSGYDRYFSIGPDFNCFYFQSVPTRYLYGNPTAATF